MPEGTECLPFVNSPARLLGSLPERTRCHHVLPGKWSSLMILVKPVDALSQENVYTSYWPSTGPTRTGPMRTGRLQPYRMARTHPNERGNAEAGPSNLAAPFVPYVGPPTPQPSGGISETTADAEHLAITEEEETTVSNFYCSHIPHVTE